MRIPPPAPKPAVTPENAEDDAQSGLAPPAPPQEDAKTFSEPDTVGEAVIDEVVSEEAERILAEDRLEPSQTENTEPGVEEGSIAESAPSPIAPPAPHIGSALSQVKSSNGYASDALEDEDHVPEEEEQDGGLHALHEAALQGEPADEQVGAESAFEGLEPVDAPDDEDIEVGDEEETATNEAEAGYAEENVENDERAAFPAPLRMESEEVHSEVALEEASELSAEDEADENDEEAPISFDGEDSNEAYSEHVSEDQGLEEFAVQEETELEAESDVAASDDQVEGAEVSEEADAAESLEEATETALEEIQSAEEVIETADEEYESAEEEAEAAAEDAEAGEVEAEAEEEAETEVEQEAEVQAETEDAAEEVLAESDDEEDAAAPFINVIPAATIDEEEDELPPTAGQLPTFEDVKKAAVRIAGKAFRTPILESAALNERVGGRVLVKPECLQRTGSFKFRGAYNRISQIRSGAEGGVVAFSSGNHAQGVAAAAQLKGIPAVIVMPEDTPDIKVSNTAGYGAEVVQYDRASGDRVAIAEELAHKRGAVIVPPYDDANIIAGQGTAGLEFAQDLTARGVSPDGK